MEVAMTVEKHTREKNTKKAPLLPEEFLGLIQPHLDGLYGVALRLSRSPGRAEELVHEATMKAYLHRESFERGTNFQAWVYRILVNAFLTEQRQKKRAPMALVDDAQIAARDPHHETSAEEWPTASEEVSDEVKKAVDELPDLFRIPLLLATLGGLPYQEIAEVLSVPVGTVMSRIHRARTRLRDELKDYARDTGWLGKKARFAHLN
jgi:RNA polymerase sigma-70 factor, ECF subfamily